MLLVVVSLPLLANNTARSDQAACINNLRLIGRAFHQWSMEHEGFMPWWLPAPTGTQSDPNKHNLWYQYAWLSKELATPRILKDPADTTPSGRTAVIWANDPRGGLANPAYQNNALSYWLGLHASVAQPLSVIAGDRNITTAGSITCAGILSARMLDPQSISWTDAVHGRFGSLVFSDGRVEQMGETRLREAISWNSNWNTHILPPGL
jgi:hypothetical protein